MTVEPATQSELEEGLRRKVADLETRLEAMTAALRTTSETLSKTTTVLATVTAERDKLRIHSVDDVIAPAPRSWFGYERGLPAPVVL